jgi:putative ABC transport system permease protein
MSRSKTILAVLGTFAVIALLLGAVGVYGIAAYAVRRSRRDIGVRLALGADAPSITREVVRRGLLRLTARAFAARLGASKLHRAALSGCPREALDGSSRFLFCGTSATTQRGGKTAWLSSR